MALFSKRCVVCDVKLPDKRMFKGMCDRCGMDARHFDDRLDSALSRVEDAKSARKAFDDCLDGIRLVFEYKRFVDKGYSESAGGRSYDELVQHFESKALGYVAVVRDQNSKRKYEKKVGLPLLSHWREIWRDKSTIPPGVCKGCFSEPADNEAGYCLACIGRATVVSEVEFQSFVDAGVGAGLEGEALTNALLIHKLKGDSNASL